MREATPDGLAADSTTQYRQFDASVPRLEQIEPRRHRDEILELFRANGKPGFARTFEWHYAASASPSRAWCLRRGGDNALVGFIAVLERRFRFGAATLRVAVGSDLMIEKSERSIGAAVALVRATQTVLDDGEFDLLLARGNALSNRLVRRLGYYPIATLQKLYFLKRSREKIRKKFGAGAALVSPIVDLAFLARRGSLRAPDGFRLQELDWREAHRIDTDRWRHGAQLAVDYPGAQLAWRYGDDPRMPARLLVLEDAAHEPAAFFAVAEPAARDAVIRDFVVDQDRLRDTDAIAALVSERRYDSVTLCLLEGTLLAAQLSHAGFVQQSMSGLPLTGMWRNEHPMAGRYAELRNWRLLPGYSDV